MLMSHHETTGMGIDEWVTIGTTGTILLVFAVFCICYWCNGREKVSSQVIREEFAREHGLDAERLAKGKLYRSIESAHQLPAIEETEIT